MKRPLLTYLILAVLLLCGVRGVAQELKVGADFTTLFDNKEYASMSFNNSGTLFGARLTPKVGIGWSKYNELMLGVDMVQDFGDGAKFLSDVNVQMYYGYRAPSVTLLAGIFPRSEMRGLKSRLFYDAEYRYYNNRIGGVLARYEDKQREGAYVEFVFDYTGMRDFDIREQFAIISSGVMPFKWFYMGYDLMVGHYACDYNPDTVEGVVDDIFVTPFVGFDFDGGGFDFDIRLTYMQSLQRDRINEGSWEAPMGGELNTAISRWGVTLRNTLYIGKGLLTYYNRYGAQLYGGSPFYNTDKGIYDAVTASYAQRFFEDSVSVSAGITMEYDGTGWGTRQWLAVGVDLDYNIALKRKQQYID